MEIDKELYFDIVSDEWAGGLYRFTKESGDTSFYYHLSLSDLDNDRTIVSETIYPDFAAFWKQLTSNNRWFTFHPLYIHPEQRGLVKGALAAVNWQFVADEKWREMYRRQWNKVLNNPAEYYKPMKP